MNYQYPSAGSHSRGAPMNKSRRKRVHNYEEDEHIKKRRIERLYWEQDGWRVPQNGIVVNQREFEGPRRHMHCPPVSAGMGWLNAPPYPPKYFNMAAQMSPIQPPNVQQLHTYNQYAACHLNHPLFPKIAPKKPVNMGGPKLPVQHPNPVPAGHLTPQSNVDLLSKPLYTGNIKIPQVPAPVKRLSQKNIDDLLANLLSAGVIKNPHRERTLIPSADRMNYQYPPNVQQLHSYNQYAACHLNHPLFPKITPRQPVNMGGPKLPVQHPNPMPAGHLTPQSNVDLSSKPLYTGNIKIPQVPAPVKRLSQKNIDNLLANLLSAGVIKKSHRERTLIPSAAVQSKEEVPDLRDFSKAKMERRYENSIQELYMETQCSKCALRFKQLDQYKKHLESHKNSTPSKCRSWYASVKDWIKHDPKESGEETKEEEIQKNQTDSEIIQSVQQPSSC